MAIRAGAALASVVASLLVLQSAAAVDCPNLQLKTKIVARAKTPSAGSPFVLTAIVTNAGSSAVTNLGVGFYLSNGLCRVKSSLRPNRKHVQNPTVAGNNLYWTGLSLKPGKRVRTRLRGLIDPAFSTPGEVSIGAVAYVGGTNCTVTAGPRVVSKSLPLAVPSLGQRQLLVNGGPA